MSSHIAELTRDIEAAKQRYAPDAAWSPESVGYFIQSVLQGAFILRRQSKTQRSPARALRTCGAIRRSFQSTPYTNRKEKS